MHWCCGLKKSASSECLRERIFSGLCDLKKHRILYGISHDPCQISRSRMMYPAAVFRVETIGCHKMRIRTAKLFCFLIHHQPQILLWNLRYALRSQPQYHYGSAASGNIKDPQGKTALPPGFQDVPPAGMLPLRKPAHNHHPVRFPAQGYRSGPLWYSHSAAAFLLLLRTELSLESPSHQNSRKSIEIPRGGIRP